MSDSYTSVTSRGLGDNLIESIKGIVVGVILFLVSFPVLWWNEGRLDISTVAKKAAVVKPDGDGTTGDGALVAVTAPLKADGELGDPEFLKPKPHVVLKRDVEMFAWVETKKTESKKKLGGGTEETTTYTYDKKWTSSPQDSSDFAHPEGHQNPSVPIARKTFYAQTAHVGAFSFSPEEAEVPSARPLELADEDLATKNGRLTSAKYIYRGKGTLDAPTLGDVRISFAAVDGGKTATLYGKRDGKEVVAYMYKGKERLYRALWGTHEEAIATMHGEYTTMTWILRGLGFVLMWFGLSLVLGPIHAVLDIIPFIGSAGRALTGIVLFPVALVLSGVTILVAIVAHNPILLGIVIVGVIGTVVFLIKRKQGQKAVPAAAKAA